VKINEIVVENQQLDELGLKDLAKGIKAVPGMAKRIGQGAMAAGGALANAKVPFGGSIGGVAGELAKKAMGDVDYAASFEPNALPTGAQHYGVGNDNLPPKGTVYLVQLKGQWFFKAYNGRWYEHDPRRPDEFKAMNAKNLSDESYEKFQRPLEDLLDQELEDNPQEVAVPVMSTNIPNVYKRNPKFAQAQTTAAPRSTGGTYTPPGPRAGRYKPGFRR
jgi:hypothetical protein